MQIEKPQFDGNFQKYGSDIVPLASFGQRFIAIVLDIVIVSALTPLLIVILKRLSLDTMAPFVGIFFPILYHVFFLSQWRGQTPGKKILGIRVVTMNATDDESSFESNLSFSQAIRRETIGRLLSGLFLTYGYLRVLFRDDRRALHDSIASTRVISLTAEQGSGVSPFMVGGGLAAFIGIAGFCGYYVLLHTSWPLKQIAKQLELNGWTIDGIDGSVSKGFSVTKISFENESGSFEVSNLNFRYTTESSPSSRRSIYVIDELSVGSGRIYIPTNPLRSDAGTNEQKAIRAPIPKSSKLAALLFRQIDLNNISIEFADGKKYLINRAYVSGLNINAIEKKLDVDRIWLQSDLLDLDANELTLESDRFFMAKPATGSVKPALFPEYLRNPVDFQILAGFSQKQLSLLSLQAGRKSLDLNWSDGVGTLQISKFTPSHYLNTDIPIWNINALVTGLTPRLSAIPNIQGTAQLRNVTFQLGFLQATHQRGPKSFLIGFMSPSKNQDPSHQPPDKTLPFLTLISSDNLPLTETLSDLYFGKPSGMLTQQEASYVEKDRIHFLDLPPLPISSPLMRMPSSLPVKSQGLPIQQRTLSPHQATTPQRR